MYHHISIEMYNEENASISFNPAAGRYTVVFAGNRFEQRVCEFLYTFSFVAHQNPEEYLLNLDDQYDFLNVPLNSTGDVLRVNSVDFFILRELYQEEMFRLKMEDLLMRSGISLAALELVTV